MKSKSILLVSIVSAVVASFACNNAPVNCPCGDCGCVVDIDGYKEKAFTDAKDNHPEDFQSESQIHRVKKASSHIAINL